MVYTLNRERSQRERRRRHACTIFAKPDFKQALPGAQRLLPDIAFVADPFTGAEVICDGTSCFGLPPGSGQQVAVVGGTSLACPTFCAAAGGTAGGSSD